MASETRDYPIQPIIFTQVSIQDAFWLPPIETTIHVTIPYDFKNVRRLDELIISPK